MANPAYFVAITREADAVHPSTCGQGFQESYLGLDIHSEIALLTLLYRQYRVLDAIKKSNREFCSRSYSNHIDG